MPFNNCQKCQRLFHFLEPERRAESEGSWPHDLDSLCPECRQAIASNERGSDESGGSLREDELEEEQEDISDSHDTL